MATEADFAMEARIRTLVNDLTPGSRYGNHQGAREPDPHNIVPDDMSCLSGIEINSGGLDDDFRVVLALKGLDCSQVAGLLVLIEAMGVEDKFF